MFDGNDSQRSIVGTDRSHVHEPQTERLELSAANHPVLPARKLQNRSIGRVFSRFSAHIADKRDSTPIRPRKVARGGA